MNVPPALSWASVCLLLLFHKDYFEIDCIGISMRKMILEVEYFITSMI